MATVGDDVHEGTTMSLCEACENIPPEMYCKDCPMKLCHGCVKIHKKVRVSSFHVIEDLSEINLDAVASGECEQGLAKCSLHEGHSLEWYCKECVLLMCEDCKSVHHKHHTFENAKDDVNIHQTICRKQVQGLFDNFHTFDEFKKHIITMIQTNDDMKIKIDNWESEIISYIKETADARRERLSEKRKSLVTIIEDPERGLTKTMDNVDKGMSTLQNLRKVADCTVLSHQLAESQELTNNMKELAKKCILSDKIPTALDMLPFESKMGDIKEGIQRLLTVPRWFDEYDLGKQVLSDGTLSKIDDIDLEEPNSRDGYRFCKRTCSKNIVIHGDVTNDVRMVNLIEKSTNQTINEKEVWNMVGVSDKYVAIESTAETMYLLNKDFTSIDAISAEEGSMLSSVVELPGHRCLMLSFTKSEESTKKATVTTFKVRNDKLVKEHEFELEVKNEPWYWYMDVDYDNDMAYICSDAALYKVNLKTEVVGTKYDLQNCGNIDGVTCLYIDKFNNILIGDFGGSVHRIDPNFNHKVILKIDDTWANDITVIDGRLIVLTKNNRIMIYA